MNDIARWCLLTGRGGGKRLAYATWCDSPMPQRHNTIMIGLGYIGERSKVGPRTWLDRSIFTAWQPPPPAAKPRTMIANEITLAVVTATGACKSPADADRRRGAR